MLRLAGLRQVFAAPVLITLTSVCLLGFYAPAAQASYGETVLHAFTANNGDGQGPESPLILAPDGYFYGTTYRGGTANSGTLFKMDSMGNVTILHSFADGSVPGDAAYPVAGVILGSDGTLYGTSLAGGTGDNGYGYGTVYKMTTDGKVTVLHSFTGDSDGEDVFAGLTFGADGKLYGATSGIEGSVATVFSLNTDGSNYLVQFRFSEDDNANYTTDGYSPYGTLTPALGSSNVLYGTTSSGGTGSAGTVFALTPGTTDGGAKLKVLHAFNDGSVSNDGASPMEGALLLDSAGNLYGDTPGGGQYGEGTLFKLQTNGTETILHSFDGTDVDGEGENPLENLLLATDGNLYGTTEAGGNFYGDNAPDGYGCLYSIAPDGSSYDSSVYQFEGTDDGNSDGFDPQAGVIEDSSGNLFGTTESGGTALPDNTRNTGFGTTFEIHAGLLPPLYLSSMSLYSTAVPGTASNTGVINFRQAAKANEYITLTSSNTSVASVPSSVYVASGAMSVTFPIATTSVKSQQYATITATSDTAPSVSATLSIFPSLASVSLSPASVQGGATTTASRAYLSGNAAYDTSVSITSNDPSVAKITTTPVVIKTGSSSHVFTIQTSAVTTSTNVTITATADGITQSAVLTVTPAPVPLSSVSLSPASTKGGTTTTANRAYLSGNANANTTVTITSSNAAVAKITTTPVTIKAGSSSHVFTIATSKVTKSTSVTIIATANGVSKSATLTVTP